MNKKERLIELTADISEIINDKIDSEVRRRIKKYRNAQRYEDLIREILRNIAIFISENKMSLDDNDYYNAQKLLLEGSLEGYKDVFKLIISLSSHKDIDINQYLLDIEKDFPLIKGYNNE